MTEQKEAYQKTVQEILQESDSDAQLGLSNAEVTERRARYGSNVLQAKAPKSFLRKFLEQFHDVMIIILLIAAAVSFGLAVYQGEAKEFFEPALILLIVIANAVIGVLQENKAEKALEALQQMAAPYCRVIREGKEQVLPVADIVPGDIVRFEAGDAVPADARLLDSSSLQSVESALTGESMAVDKDAAAVISANAPLGDRINMVYAGCSITYGTGMALVTATGMQTEMGKIAGLLAGEEDQQTPLQKRLADLGKYLGFFALAACVVIFIMGLLDGIPMLEIFMTAVSLAVSAIPEGLPAIVTIVLALGVQQMAKRNAIVKRLPAVETLGSASVICSDKTGTLTQNRMTLVRIYDAVEDRMEDVTDANSESGRRLMNLATLCCNGSLDFEGDEVHHIGDPTETCIVYASHRNGSPKDALNAVYQRFGELPFDSDRKLMTTINRIDDVYTVITKGGFDMLAERCCAGDLEKGRIITEEMSAQALRVLAVGIRQLDHLPTQEEMTSEQLEKDLTFIGLLGMIDPPREEVRDAVAVCKKAGIRPVMITGDHVITATAIAKNLGIFREGDLALTGAQLDALSEEELHDQIEQISVYARVSPENKIRIVKAWQSRGHVVAMTGDGVNDAPALKAADIGCAMGITGTDVSKEAADMILTDDNFTTIVAAVEAGRAIYANIRKSVCYLLGTNIGELLTVFTAMLLWRTSPLLSMQLLWINLVTDSLPAIALGMEKTEPDVMDQPPKAKGEGIFSHGLRTMLIAQGLMFGALSLIAYQIGIRATGDITAARTMTFLVLALVQIIHSFNMRSHRSLFRTGVFGNAMLNKAALLSIALIAFVLFVPPVTYVFKMTLLQPWMYLAGVALALVPVVVSEILKAFGCLHY